MHGQYFNILFNSIIENREKKMENRECRMENGDGKKKIILLMFKCIHKPNINQTIKNSWNLTMLSIISK